MASALLSAGCTGLMESVRPAPRPANAEADSGPDLAEPVASAEFIAARMRYSDTEAGLQARGLLRTDNGGAELAGLDAETLANTFIRVAMFDEFDPALTGSGASGTANVLRRWESPVRVRLEFGASVAASERETDTAVVRELARRLGAAAKHPVALTEGEGNLIVFVVDGAEERALAPRLREAIPGIPPSVVLGVTGVPLSEACFSAGFSSAQAPFAFSRGVIIIRAEQPDLSRQSCYHEEIAQALGLVNDVPEARPSIFNDDEEFALLTALDELMLAMLYDPRLSPGMTLDEVQPRAQEIARELLPGAAETAPEPQET
ncbi:MAG: DUF2927 domain-containing protein [Pseudomonadota bacterium]